MNLIKGEQEPQSDLGFLLTFSLGSDGLSTGGAGWNAKDTPCVGAAGVGEGRAGRALPSSSCLYHLTSLAACSGGGITVYASA
jgi:hypothetical protein